MRLMSYNLRKHAAAPELAGLVDRHAVDVLCVQEAYVDDIPPQIGGLRLADSTHHNRLGLAVYFRMSMYHPLEVRSLALKKSLHDRVLKPADERMLAVRMHDIDQGREVLIASFHAAPLTALNSLRRHQIRTALGELRDMGPGLPTLMVGDYNYPVFKERLGLAIREQGFEFVMSDTHTYTRYRYSKGFYDFATATGFDIDRIHTLPQGRSDHLPILINAHMSRVPHRRLEGVSTHAHVEGDGMGQVGADGGGADGSAAAGAGLPGGVGGSGAPGVVVPGGAGAPGVVVPGVAGAPGAPGVVVPGVPVAAVRGAAFDAPTRVDGRPADTVA